MSPRKTVAKGDQLKVTPKPIPVRFTVRYVANRVQEHQGPDGRVAQKDIEATPLRDEASPLWHGTLSMTIRNPEVAAAFELGKEFTVEYEVQT
jgi:hypothetical protein